MQCTWISLNLTKTSNQARRWVEGLFSRSKYASYNKMCKREPPKASHTLFISPLKEIAVGYFQWVVVVHTGRVLVLFFSRTRPVWTWTASGALDRLKTDRCCQLWQSTGLSTLNTPDSLEWDRMKTQRALQRDTTPDSHLGRVASGVAPDASGPHQTKTQSLANWARTGRSTRTHPVSHRTRPVQTTRKPRDSLRRLSHRTPYAGL